MYFIFINLITIKKKEKQIFNFLTLMKKMLWLDEEGQKNGSHDREKSDYKRKQSREK